MVPQPEEKLIRPVWVRQFVASFLHPVVRALASSGLASQVRASKLCTGLDNKAAHPNPSLPRSRIYDGILAKVGSGMMFFMLSLGACLKN